MILSSAAFVTIILLIWFRTEAFVEYSKLFKRNDISDYKKYESLKKMDERLTYLSFLSSFHDCFMIRLLLCPICLSFWIAFFTSLITANLLSFPIIMVGGLFGYLILNKLLD
jgi:hypothetical protein